jgi:hypothetical protein
MGVPFLFLMLGLGCIAWLAASLRLGKPVPLIVVAPPLRALLVGASCGVAILTFFWWLFMEIKRR